MTAVDATEAAIAKCYGYPSLADVPEGARWFRRLAEAALAALFARAGIDGPGTIALTRDEEGRYGLKRATTGTAHWSASAGAWLYPLVPVEDDDG